MMQMINITEARSTLSGLVKKVSSTGKSVVIIQNSEPSVMIVPYKKKYDPDAYMKKLLSIKGGWDFRKEHAEIRRQIKKRLERNEL